MTKIILSDFFTENTPETSKKIGKEDDLIKKIKKSDPKSSFFEKKINFT